MNYFKKYILVLGFLFCQVSSASEWENIGYMPNGNGVYSAALIESAGVFSKKITVWFKADYKLHEIGCGDVERGPNVYCIAAKNREQEEPKETIYKVIIDCDRKTLYPVEGRSLDFRGRQVVDNKLNLDSYPGSIGESLVGQYCN